MCLADFYRSDRPRRRQWNKDAAVLAVLDKWKDSYELQKTYRSDNGLTVCAFAGSNAMAHGGAESGAD
jgi:hypothetical protein